MKGLSKFSSRVLFFAAAFVMTAGVIVSTRQTAYARGGVEDTWSSSDGDCSGPPTDCLDTVCIGPGCLAIF